MQPLDTIRVYRHGREPGLIQLFHGDLTAMPAGHEVKVLVVSAYPRDYWPMGGTVIGALHDKGVSVEELADDPEADLRDVFGCWLSRRFDPPSGVRAERILCFEPETRDIYQRPNDVVEALYQALAPFVAGRFRLNTVAMPLVSTGNVGCDDREIAVPLVGTALRWMQSGFPLDVVKLVCFRREAAQTVQEVFRELKQQHALYDVFLSYCHQDKERVDEFLALLRERQPGLTVFCDRVTLEGGHAWRGRILDAVRSSSFFVPFYSPDYLLSVMCVDEFGTALMASQLAGRPRLFPVLLTPANGLPKIMTEIHYVDCTRGGLSAACEQLLRLVTGRTV
jgi:O-acetyl-ADP-ribose deacetylase (regulator of RNase III)